MGVLKPQREPCVAPFLNEYCSECHLQQDEKVFRV